MKQIQGIITALITPFKEGEIDYNSLGRLIADQLKKGVSGFVVNGTTGESPTLSDSEVYELFLFCKKSIPTNVSLILGTGTNSTASTISKNKMAAEMGADAALVVVPYYNKPPQRGLYQHFTQVADQGNIPIILYNVPGRTVASLSLETIVSLSENKNILGIKEASGDVPLAKELRRKCREDFILLSGDDASFVEFLAAGGNGTISVLSHVLAGEMKKWWELILAGEIETARKESSLYRDLIEAIGLEVNPIPVKKAVELMGLIDCGNLRLPLVELEATNVEILKSSMESVGLLK
jgi:4-hydroxy-tetrahydrodipicolinate synthase